VTREPSIARMYNYWLGGTDNTPADRAAGDAAVAAHPGLLTDARANRAFVRRAVRFLAAEAGVAQFLDIGSGIPFGESTYDVAAAHQPSARVVYADNDPVVAARYATPPPGTGFVAADLRDPESILAGAGRLIDFDEPVGVLLVAVLHLIPDSDGPHDIVARLMAAVPPGSYLALSHVPSDLQPAPMAQLGARLNGLLPGPSTYRTRAQVARFFDGLTLVPPGLVPVPRWRPDDPADAAADVAVRGGVARKPLAAMSQQSWTVPELRLSACYVQAGCRAVRHTTYRAPKTDISNLVPGKRWSGPIARLACPRLAVRNPCRDGRMAR
jgi:S-adenosyl methyltransferase